MFVELTREWMGQKAGAVIDLADPDAIILTDGGVAKIVASDPLSPLLTKAMGSMFDGMLKAVDAAINKALADLQTAKTLPRNQAAAKIFGADTRNRAAALREPRGFKKSRSHLAILPCHEAEKIPEKQGVFAFAPIMAGSIDWYNHPPPVFSRHGILQPPYTFFSGIYLAILPARSKIPVF
jgi:hypothetical protein